MSKTTVTMTKDSAQEYHSKAYISNSMLSQMNKSPAHFHEAMKATTLGKKEVESDAFLLGSLFHMALLEPELVERTYKRKDFLGTTKEGKAEKADAERKGLTLVRADIWDHARAMAEAVYESTFWATVTLKASHKEVSLYWEEEGLKCKARIDMIADVPQLGRIIVDLKSTSDASPQAIQKSMANFGYHRQAAWYRRALSLAGITTEGFALCFVEKTPPYAMTVAIVSEDAIATGLEECKFLFEQVKAYSSCNYWPPYEAGPITIDLPTWYTPAYMDAPHV